MSIATGIRRLTRILIVATLGFAAMFASVPEPADAYVAGDCQFSGTQPVIKYWFNSVNSAYKDFFNTAQYRWDITSAPGYFVSGGTSSDHNIDVQDIWSTSNANAWVGGGCGSSGIWYNNQVDMTFNTRRMNTRSNLKNRITASHELGHAYGLDHSSLGCSNPVVMRSYGSWAYDNCGASSITPYSNDVAGVHYMY